MNNLADMLSNLGKYKDAKQMHRQALQLREKVLGRKHPDTLSSIGNLALVLVDLGRHEKAQQMHRQALQLFKKVLGKEDPSTRRSRQNLDNC
ncbi:Kinesin light chain 1 [Metarhizium anisopliae]|nr:Kinesin light chain 1 [Metarhizium anisopliae]KAF5136430.1 Kinesin light chain 1 [Metarhizium anisopliae]